MALRVLIALLILAIPLEISGCSVEASPPFFIAIRPEHPLDFARGQLGILQPTYERFYQVIAYRFLEGVGLNDAERDAALRSHGILPPDAPAVPETNPWLEARNKVPGVKPVHYINRDRLINDPGRFEIFENCHDDAFKTAAATLAGLIGSYGAKDPATVDWIAAQDTVFSNCAPNSWGDKQPAPAIPKETADTRLHAQRAYQIAAAKFYSRQYDAARQDFQSIAADQSSPWRTLAPYLAARCLIRAGNFDGAQTELRRIAGDPALSQYHDSAERLLEFVGCRRDPALRMHQAALTLVHPNSQASIARDLTDYRFLFDKDVKPEPADDLSEWIRSFQANGTGALETWRARQTLPWLVAALHAAQPADKAVPELIAAARTVKSDSPAYVTVGFHLVRLLPNDEARAKADELLAATLPTEARNRLRGERMRLVRDFDDFLRYAPRHLVGEQADSDARSKQPMDFLDGDSATILSRGVPLSLIKRAAGSSLLPDHVRQDLSRVVFVRTLLLSDAPKFDDVFTVLKTPGMHAFVSSGYVRGTPDKIDSFRDNWWCALAENQSSGVRFWVPASGSDPSPDVEFLPAADRTQAAGEWKKLESIPAAPNWLGAQTLAFAQAHPQDTRVPEALYLVVRATRYGCTDAKTGDISKRAFDLLHSRYAGSEWTRKTPYWFK